MADLPAGLTPDTATPQTQTIAAHVDNVKTSVNFQTWLSGLLTTVAGVLVSVLTMITYLQANLPKMPPMPPPSQVNDVVTADLIRRVQTLEYRTQTVPLLPVPKTAPVKPVTK